MFKHINIIDKPNIIPSTINYNYEPYYNTPNIVFVIENKTLTNEILNALALNKDELIYKIDYEDKNPNSVYNIFNVFNTAHKQLIESMDKTVGSSFYKNNYENHNFNFAYHYFIDKKGNIYEGRPHNVRAYNLDIYRGVIDQTNEIASSGLVYGKILNPGDLLFNESLFILTEEQTDEMDTTNATYTALKSLLIYLRQAYGLKNFFCYSELQQNSFIPVNDPKEDMTMYNNPGLFFKVNELHSAVEKVALKGVNQVPNTTIKTYTYGDRVLKYTNPKHMEGNDVLMLQKMLYKLDIITKYKDITGIYDLMTKNYVSKFQKKFYIKPEYDYGVACKTTLNTLRNKIYQEKIKNIKIIDDRYSLNRTLEYNPINPMVGIDVLLLQTRLKLIISPILKETGIFDQHTEDAVLMFHEKYKLFDPNENLNKEDLKKVGPASWDKIFSCKDRIFVAKSDSDIPGTITPTTNTVSKDSMIYLQKALNMALKNYGVQLELTGIYDEPTQHYIEVINKNESNRKIMELDKLPINWHSLSNDSPVYKSCYPSEYVYLVKHYLLGEKIELALVY